MEKRAEIIIYGRVQKTGFRDFIDEIAFDLNLKGFVKNLKDGTVNIVCEGEEELINELLNKVNIVQYPIRVEKIEVTFKKPTGEYKTFEIIRDEDLTVATYERMDAAVRYMREMNSNLGNKIDRVSYKIDQTVLEIREMNSNLGNKIDQNSKDIREMNSNLGNKIDQNSKDIREMNSNLGNKIDQNSKDIREMNSNLGQKTDIIGSKIDQSRTEISSEIRQNRDDFKSHLDERITNIEHELTLIKAKEMPSKDF